MQLIIPVCRNVPAWANAQVPKTVDMFLSGIGRTGMRYVPVISFPRATSRLLFCCQKNVSTAVNLWYNSSDGSHMYCQAYNSDYRSLQTWSQCVSPIERVGFTHFFAQGKNHINNGLRPYPRFKYAIFVGCPGRRLFDAGIDGIMGDRSVKVGYCH